MTDDDARPVLADRLEHPAGMPDRLLAQVRFILEADQLKTVLRRSRLIAADRPENDAEHSWHLALMVLVLAEYADEPIDVGHTLALVVAHELVEIYAGDTFIYDDEGRADQAEREERAAQRLFGLLPRDQATRLRGLWDEFEAARTPEARFAKAMDRLEPLMLNINTQGGTWQSRAITADMVRERKAGMRQASTALWAYADSLVDHAVAQGWLPRPSDAAPGGALDGPAVNQPDVADLLSGLRARGLRVTAPRQFVIEVLAAAEAHLTVEQIHAAVTMRSPAINLSTVHRTVSTLLEERIAHAVPSRRGLTYGLAHDHRHHTLCRICGRTQSLVDPVASLTGIPRGFEAEAVIVYGRCCDCATGATPEEGRASRAGSTP